jgi:hypothetical protein
MQRWGKINEKTFRDHRSWLQDFIGKLEHRLEHLEIKQGYVVSMFE